MRCLRADKISPIEEILSARPKDQNVPSIQIQNELRGRVKMVKRGGRIVQKKNYNKKKTPHFVLTPFTAIASKSNKSFFPSLTLSLTLSRNLPLPSDPLPKEEELSRQSQRRRSRRPKLTRDTSIFAVSQFLATRGKDLNPCMKILEGRQGGRKEVEAPVGELEKPPRRADLA